MAAPAELDDSYNNSIEFDPDAIIDEFAEAEDYFFVPKNSSFNRYLNGLQFDYTLDEEDLSLMNKLCALFGDMDDEKSVNLANDLLQKALDQKKNEIFNDNPFTFVLKLIINTDLLDDPHAKSVPFQIANTLNRYLNLQDPATVKTLQCMITDLMKQVAFEVSYKHLAFFREILQAYQLKIRCEAINDRLKKMLENHDYKSVSRIVDYLGYWNDFAPHEIVIPLIFRDQLQVVEEFFAKMSAQRKEETFKILDSFFDKEYAVEENCLEFALQHNINGLKIVKLDAQPLMKTTEKLLEKSHWTNEKLPNMNKILTRDRVMATLKRYEKIGDADGLFDADRALKGIIKKDDKDLQELVIEFNLQHGHHVKAKQWCKYFGMPENNFYKETNEYLDENDNKEKNPMPLFLIDKSVKIITIDDSASFERMCNFFARMKFVAIDVEGDIPTASAVLIQISTQRHISIIDIIALEKQRFDHEEWNVLKKTLFDNTKILKLGFNWNADALMIQRRFNIDVNISNGSFLDLQKAWETLCEHQNFKLPFQYDKGDGRKHQDLKTFVEFTTGKTLDKSLRTKDFNIRPLTEKMRQYAATDANSLLHAYFVFKREARRYGRDVDSMTLK